MSYPYDELERLRNEYRSGEINKPMLQHAVVCLLEDNKIYLRQDAELVEVNYSYPTTEPDTIIIGLRYQKYKPDKRGGLDTENLFVFRKGSPDIEKQYLGNGYLPEYENTHKLKPNSDKHHLPQRDLWCNTLSIGCIPEKE